MSLTEDERKAFEVALKEAETGGNARIATAFGEFVVKIEEVLKRKLTDEDGNPITEGREHRSIAEQAANFSIDSLEIRSPERRAAVDKLFKHEWMHVEAAIDARDRALNSMKRGDELRSG